jgi:phospholipase/carboxylesterase
VANRTTPIFMAHGMLDPTISHALGEMSRDYLVQRGYAVAWHAYPMAHQACMEEIADLKRWMSARLTDK